MTISEFVQSYKSSKYVNIEVRDQTIIGTLAPSQPSTETPLQFPAVTPPSQTEVAILPSQDSLKDIGITIDNSDSTAVKIIDTSSMHFWADLAPTIIGTVLFLGLFILLMGRMMANSG